MNADPSSVQWPTDEEAQEAFRRGIPSLVYVWNRYEVGGGLARPVAVGVGHHRRSYYPITSPSIVTELARLREGDQDQVLAFVRRWGVLGYQRMVDRPSTGTAELGDLMREGDPLVWLWAHARGMRTAVDLHRFVRSGNADGIADYFNEMTLTESEALEIQQAARETNRLLEIEDFEAAMSHVPALFPSRSNKAQTDVCLPVVVFGGRHSVRAMRWGVQDSQNLESHLLSTARSIIEYVVNPNLVGINQTLLYFGEPHGPSLRQSGDSVLSIAYNHLADMITASSLVQCEECGAWFAGHDKRQRYCPPQAGLKGGESLCAMRARQRRKRSRTV